MSRYKRGVHSRITNMVRQGIVTLSKKIVDGVARAQVEGIDDGDVDDYPVYGPPGFIVRPPLDAEALIGAPAGDPDQEAVIGFTGRGHAPTKTSDSAEIPAGCGGLYRASNFVLYFDDAGNLYLGGDKGNVVTKLSRADKTDAEFARIWTHLKTSFAATAGDGGAALWALQVSAAGVASTASQSTEADNIYGK